MVEPISAVAAGTATFRLFGVIWNLAIVNDETATFLQLAQRVQKDLDETHRLRRLYSHQLPPAQGANLNAALWDAEAALRGVAALLEDCRLDVQKRGSVSLKNKITWVFRDSPEMHAKTAGLNTSQNSLHVWLGLLLSIEYASTSSRGQEKGFESQDQKQCSSQLNAFLQHRRTSKKLEQIGHMSDLTSIADTCSSGSTVVNDSNSASVLPPIRSLSAFSLVDIGFQELSDVPLLPPRPPPVSHRHTAPVPLIEHPDSDVSTAVHDGSVSRSANTLEPGELPRSGWWDDEWNPSVDGNKFIDLQAHGQEPASSEASAKLKQNGETNRKQSSDFVRGRSTWLAYHRQRTTTSEGEDDGGGDVHD